MSYTYNGQAAQDLFVLSMTGFKRDGTFLEIGSSHPITMNNSYLLETQFNWRGIMVEYDSKYLPLYKEHRPKSTYILQDAQTIDYRKALEDAKMPMNIDYLQIDLDVQNRSTLNVLELLDRTVFDTYTFATITFEHDIYAGDHYNTRERSREILQHRGYTCVFEDVANRFIPFEDWYIHPSLIPLEHISNLLRPSDITYERIVDILEEFNQTNDNHTHIPE